MLASLLIPVPLQTAIDEPEGILGWLALIVMAILVGWVMTLVMPGEMPLGLLGTFAAGIVGALVGAFLFPDWGPGWELGGVSVVPSVLGALVVGFVVRLIMVIVDKSYS